MKISEILEKGKQILEENKIEDVNQKSYLMLEYLLDISHEYLVRNKDEEVDEDTEYAYLNYIDEIKSGYPIEYIIHKKEFMYDSFYVNENTLIPQYDTEIVVEEAYKRVLELLKNKDSIKVLDMCTGTGAIAISILRKLKIENIDITKVEIYASDISKKALEVFDINNENIANNKVIKIESDLFNNIKDIKFDLIVSNPPYIDEKEYETLSNEVKNEPKLALVADDNGLYFYKKIIEEAAEYLNNDSYLVFEIGYNQKEDLKNIINNNDNYEFIDCIKDLNNQDRCIICKRL